MRRLARDSHRTAETDLQFIQRILAENGIWFRTGVNTTTGLDTVTFADSQLQYQFDVRLPYREPSALHDGAVEAVWDARVWHHTVTGSVATRDYNYRTAGTPMDAKVSVRSEAATTDEHYCYPAPYREAGNDITSEQETDSGAFYARIRHEHVLNNAIRLHLFSNASHLTPGMVLETGDSGVPELKEGMVITLTTFRAARDTRLHVSVWGMPYSEQFCFRPASIPRPLIAGMLMARVESDEKNALYAHLDETGRYQEKVVSIVLKVKSAGFRRQDHQFRQSDHGFRIQEHGFRRMAKSGRNKSEFVVELNRKGRSDYIGINGLFGSEYANGIIVSVPVSAESEAFH